MKKQTKKELLSALLSELGRKRWIGVSAEERSKLVPHNGGRPRKHPKCPRYKTHQFWKDRCACGYIREPEP